MIVLGCAMTPVAQSFLSNPVSRFLGNISFSLYLVHLLVICSLSSALFLAMLNLLPFAATVTIVAIATLLASIAGAWAFQLIVERWMLAPIKRVIAAAVKRTVVVISASTRWPFAPRRPQS